MTVFSVVYLFKTFICVCLCCANTYLANRFEAVFISMNNNFSSHLFVCVCVCVCVCLVDMNITTHGNRLTPLLVAALYSVKNSIVWMLGQKDCAEIQTSAVNASGQNALHLVVQNQQCEYSLEVSLYIHTLSLVIVTALSTSANKYWIFESVHCIYN